MNVINSLLIKYCLIFLYDKNNSGKKHEYLFAFV